MPMTYAEFLESKHQRGAECGFNPLWMPDSLFDFQRALVEWAIRKGRAAIFADCGLGKTAMQLTWAENVVRHTAGRVLVLTPIAVGIQTVAEGMKFGVECGRSRDGRLPEAKIVVANYEILHKFNPSDFAGIVCDESSVLKHFSGITQKEVTRFACKIPYRLLCTATPAPNDFTELGTSSEVLGELGYSDMLSKFFAQTDNKGHRMQEIKNQKLGMGGNYFGKLSFRAAQMIGQWRLKAHAEIPFWRWVAYWAKTVRKPSDLGFPDGVFLLPPLEERMHVIKAARPADGMLFTVTAFGLGEEREERKRTIVERCEAVAKLVDHDRPAIVWVQYNSEGDRIERLVPGAVQVSGADSDEEKEEKLMAFVRGQARVLVTKAKVAGFGLNMQHCSDVVTFVTHSYESYYQSIRRCWRFGQRLPVTVDIIATEGEGRVADNMKRKGEQCAHMFERIVRYVNEAQKIERENHSQAMEVPRWL